MSRKNLLVQFGLLAIHFVSLSVKHQLSCSAFVGFLLLMNTRKCRKFQHLIWANKKILKKAFGKCISIKGGNPSEKGVEDLLVAAQLHEGKWLLRILTWHYLTRLLMKCIKMGKWEYYAKYHKISSRARKYTIKLTKKII